MNTEQLAAQGADLMAIYFRNRDEIAGLQQQLISLFDEPELRTFSMELGINYDALPGSGTAAKSREIVLFCLRRNQIDELVNKCQASRPDNFKPPKWQMPDDNDMVAVDLGQQLYAALDEQWKADPYTYQMLQGLIEMPESDSRKANLANMISDSAKTSPEVIKLLESIVSQNPVSGDTINQSVEVKEKAKTGDITVIGKVDGGSVNVGGKKKGRWRFW